MKNNIIVSRILTESGFKYQCRSENVDAPLMNKKMDLYEYVQIDA